MHEAPDLIFASNYARCLERLNWAIGMLDGQTDPAQMAATAGLIIHAMSGTWRRYHTPEHIFEVGESGDAVEVLAALFHDAVYVQIDVGVTVSVARKLAPFIMETDKCLSILAQADLPADPVFDMVMLIFDMVPGQKLIPTQGQNEFLSAVVAAKSLEPALQAHLIAQVAACIEATIPFRHFTPPEKSPGQQLHDRLGLVNQRFGFGWSDNERHDMVRRTVRLANRDVENFSNESSSAFLDNTWNLMPETNHDLISSNAYTVTGYRSSLQKIDGFLLSLNPAVVFQTYLDEPGTGPHQHMMACAQKNLAVARLYLGSKLLSIAIIEAMSRRLGMDISLTTVMGELPQHGLPQANIQNFLPATGLWLVPESPLEREVLDLLEYGRSASSSYDLKNSPVATYIIKTTGFAHAWELLAHAKAFFSHNLSAEAFLALCDQEIVAAIVEAILNVFAVRVAAIALPSLSPTPACQIV